MNNNELNLTVTNNKKQNENTFLGISCYNALPAKKIQLTQQVFCDLQ